LVIYLHKKYINVSLFRPHDITTSTLLTSSSFV